MRFDVRARLERVKFLLLVEGRVSWAASLVQRMVDLSVTLVEVISLLFATYVGSSTLFDHMG